jgi:hypothetical protein
VPAWAQEGAPPLAAAAEPAPSPTPIPSAPPLAESAALALQKLHGSATLDLFTPFHLQGGSADGSRMEVRSLEASVFGPIDDDLEAQLTVAGHDQSGLFTYDLHEAFIASSKLLAHTRFKLGRFLLPLGLLSGSSRSSWPMTSAPKVQTRFFSDDVLIDTGAELTLGDTSPEHASLTVGVTNGYAFGHESLAMQKPLAPSHYLRPIYHGGTAAHPFNFGATYFARTDSDSTHTRIAGFDLAVRDPISGNFLQSEVFYRYQKAYEIPLVEEVGGYVFFESPLSERLRAGLRLDGLTTLSLRKQTGEKQTNFNWAAMPSLAYSTSPASLLRLSYLYSTEVLEGNSDRVEQRLELQWIARLGTLPSP